MRILFTSTAGLGHVHPLLPFVRAAQARGDEVRLAIPTAAQPAAAGFGVPLVPTDVPAPAEAGPFWAALFEQDDPDSYVIGRWFGGMCTRAALPAVHAEVETWEPDLVLSEAAEVAGQLCAELAGAGGLGQHRPPDARPARDRRCALGPGDHHLRHGRPAGALGVTRRGAGRHPAGPPRGPGGPGAR